MGGVGEASAWAIGSLVASQVIPALMGGGSGSGGGGGGGVPQELPPLLANLNMQTGLPGGMNVQQKRAQTKQPPLIATTNRSNPSAVFQQIQPKAAGMLPGTLLPPSAQGAGIGMDALLHSLRSV